LTRKSVSIARFAYLNAPAEAIFAEPDVPASQRKFVELNAVLAKGLARDFRPP
jgi:hypothetical protein